MSFENRDKDNVVTDPERPDATRAETDVMRPIPDGGLQQSMPEWLRRPPAWRNLPKREEPVESVPAAAPVVVQERELPTPDTSEIDPRSLVDIADLPQWLQDLAARSDVLSSSPVTTDEPVSDATEEHTMSDPQRDLDATRESDARDVSFEPVDKKRWAIPDEETKVYGGPKRAGMSWQVMLLIGLIALVVIILIVMLVL